MRENNKKYDAIIVGGGHNGLVAACYLAKAGKSVILLESNKELGGATASVKTFPEYDARPNMMHVFQDIPIWYPYCQIKLLLT